MASTSKPAGNPGAAAPGKPGKAHTPKKPKKPMGRFAVAALSVFATLLVLAGGAVAVYLNAAGLAQQVIEMIPQYRVAFEELERVRVENEAAKAEIEAARAKLDADTKADASALDKRTADLDALEARLAEDRKALDERATDDAAAEENRKKAVEIYTNMEASTAAEMLDQATTLQEVAAILGDLPAEKAAEILAEMDAKKAFDILRLMNQ